MAEAVGLIVKDRNSAHSAAQAVKFPDDMPQQARDYAVKNAQNAATVAARKKLAEIKAAVSSALTDNTDKMNTARYPERQGGDAGKQLSATEISNANTMRFKGKLPAQEITQAVAERRLSLAAGLVQRGQALNLADVSIREKQAFDSAVKNYEDAVGLTPMIETERQLQKAAKLTEVADEYLAESGPKSGQRLIAFGLAMQN